MEELRATRWLIRGNIGVIHFKALGLKLKHFWESDEEPAVHQNL